MLFKKFVYSFLNRIEVYSELGAALVAVTVLTSNHGASERVDVNT